MSTTNDDRGSKRGNTDNRSTGQQRQNTTPRDSNIQNRRGGKGGVTTPNVNSKTPESPSTPNLPVQDEHVPLKGFNVVDADNLLKRGFDAKATLYKPEAQSQKSSSVWGAKVGAMANGKDFWLELRKQVTALQQSGGLSQGG